MRYRFNAITKGVKEIYKDRGERENHFWLFVVNNISSSFLVPAIIRGVVLRSLGIQLTFSSQIKPNCIIRTRNLTVGKGSTLNYNCVLDNRAPITIGDYVGIGIGVSMITSSHNIENPDIRSGLGTLSEIIIEDGVFIGSNATILQGVRVCRGAVIGAGAVVTKDCEEDGLYIGAPARKVRTINVRTL